MSRFKNLVIIVIAVSFLIFNNQPCLSQTTPVIKEPIVDKSSYFIGFGDILEITTWKEADFSRPEVLVRLDGMITFPLINDIQARGKTPMQVKTDIETRLADYVESPVVTVTVRSSGSKRFYILGEIMRTGEYPLVKNLTVL